MGSRSLMHPALAAWERANLEVHAETLDRAIPLKERPRSSVYRLSCSTPTRSALSPTVIAKCSTPESSRVEELVHGEVMPHLGLPTPRYLGCDRDLGTRTHWIFLEDLGDRPYDPTEPEQRTQAARWLARLHLRSAGHPQLAELPQRGADAHALLLRHATQNIADWLGSPTADDYGLAPLRRIQDQLTDVARSWREVEETCDSMPLCLVHGDFVSKNLRRVPTDGGATVVVPFDWHAAGAGPAGLDLGATILPETGQVPDIQTYLAEVSGTWPWLDRHTLLELAHVGKLFWSLSCIAKDSSQLGREGHTSSLKRLLWYVDELERILLSEEKRA